MNTVLHTGAYQPMKSDARKRIEGLFARRPKAKFTVAEVAAIYKDINPATLHYNLRRLVKDEVLVHLDYNSYQFNEAEVKQIDMVRAAALALGKERVVSDPATMFKPGEQVITAVENPSVILSLRRGHFLSILDRIRPYVSQYDIAFLERELKELVVTASSNGQTSLPTVHEEFRAKTPSLAVKN